MKETLGSNEIELKRTGKQERPYIYSTAIGGPSDERTESQG